MGDPGATAIPSEAEISPVLDSILQSCDMDSMTLRKVMTRLAEHFGVSYADLAVRKKFVRHATEAYLTTSYHPADEPPAQRADPAAAKEEAEDASSPGGNAGGGARAPRARAAGSKRPRGGGGGGGGKGDAPGADKKIYLTNLEKAVILAEPLAEFLSELVLPRTHVSKRISNYIKQHGLQNPADRRQILCDDKLKALFNTDSFTFFSVNKLTSNLLYKVEEVDDEELKRLAEECNAKRLAEKQAEHDAKVASGEYVAPAKKSKKAPRDPSKPAKPNGLTREMILSPLLAEVCGGPRMSRSHVVKQLWAYIKANKLQSGKTINCDAKLQEIFDGNAEVSNFGMMKFIGAHLTKPPEEA